MRSTEYALPTCCCAELWLDGIPDCDWRIFRIRFPLQTAAARLSSSPRPLEFHFNSARIVNVVRVKSYMSFLFHPVCIKMGITINKLYFVPGRAVSGVVGIVWDDAGLCLSEWDIPVVILDSLLPRSASLADVNLSTLNKNPVYYATLFSQQGRRHPLGVLDVTVA